MNLARWSIDYIQKKSKKDPSPRPKTITELVVEEKLQRPNRPTDRVTPNHV